ncbi:MAG: peptide/nickel transport system ATP-binding protein [Candidatus Azotimanducaceae bacterium]|jgi:peptide/nickel transport system ATP-binding protein
MMVNKALFQSIGIPILAAMQKPLISVEDLRIKFGETSAINGISYHINQGEILALVGESGSGKSVSSLAIMGLLPKSKVTIEGAIFLNTEKGTSALLQQDENAKRKLRGKVFSMIFQEPMTSLNPVITCGQQVMELILIHENCSKKEARKRCLGLFEQVKLPRAEALLDVFPHEISGGQRQRVMIAMAIACKPSLLIADEPTTALDVTVQKSILDLLKDIQKETGMSILFITHDLGVVKEFADRVLVMNQGVIVEEGTVTEIFEAAKDPYTQGLIACRPSILQRLKLLPTVSDFTNANTSFKAEVERLEERQERHKTLYSNPPLLSVSNLGVWFTLESNWLGTPKSYIKAVNNVSFDVFKGETLGLIGESGCGKSTLGRSIIGLNDIHDGEIVYQGKSLQHLGKKDWLDLRKKIQFIFQDPYSSLNPKHTVGQCISEPQLVHKLVSSKKEAKQKTEELLVKVGLLAEHYDRYPHEFSGGQRQRIGIARALAVQPELIICDESVSALDVSVQSQVLNLLNALKLEFNLTYIFISHDMSVVKHMSDRLLVMNKGEIEEAGESDGIYANPKSAFTQKLMASVPKT